VIIKYKGKRIFKMLPNCRGCVEDIREATYLQDQKNLYLATNEETNIDTKGHTYLILVNDKGKIIIN